MDQLAPSDTAPILELAYTLVQAFVWTLFLYVLPGFVLLNSCYGNSRLTLGEKLALAISLGVSLYPLLYLWANVAGIRAGAWVAWGPGLIASLIWLWQLRTTLSQGASGSQTAVAPQALRRFAWPALFVLVLALSRFLPVQAMTAPAWGDSVHHTLIVQLLQDNKGLFQSWAPYAPIESFTYHFGFHANMAVWATVTGQPLPQAVISGGQLFNILAVLALYPAAVRLGGSRMAGLGALIVAGLVSLQPGMYVNWGRYTQLAAQVILPAWLWAMDVWWTERKRPPVRFLFLVVLLATGLALTHYRVAIIALGAAVAWGAWSLWVLRGQWRDWIERALWLAGAGIASLALIAPWAQTVRAGRLPYVVGAIAQRGTDAAEMRSEMAVWRSIGTHYAPYLWIASLSALVVALWRRRRLSAPLLIWLAVAFLAANPILAGVAGTGIVTNFLLAIGLYIPMSLLVGWLLAEIWRAARLHRVSEVAFAVALILLAAAGFREQSSVVDPFYQMVTRRTSTRWSGSIQTFRRTADSSPTHSLRTTIPSSWARTRAGGCLSIHNGQAMSRRSSTLRNACHRTWSATGCASSCSTYAPARASRRPCATSSASMG